MTPCTVWGSESVGKESLSDFFLFLLGCVWLGGLQFYSGSVGLSLMHIKYEDLLLRSISSAVP